MFCRKCGKTLLDGDRFCSYCGAQVIERNASVNTVENMEENVEEVVYNNETPFELPVAEMKDVVAGQKIIVQTQDEIDSKDLKKQVKTNWNLDGFPSAGEESKKTEDIKVDWAKRELLRFETMPEHKTENVNVFSVEEKLEKKTEIETRTEKDTDIFELFNKQTEVVEVKQNSIEPNLEQELFGTKNKTIDKLHTPEEEQIDKFYTFSKKNEEFQKLLDKEYERLKQEPEFVAPEPKLTSNIEKLELNMPHNLYEEVSTSKQKFEDEDIDKSGLSSIFPMDEKIIENNIDKAVEKIIEDENPELSDEKDTAEKSIDDLEKEQEGEGTTESLALPWDEGEGHLAEFSDEDAKKKISPLAIVLAVIIFLLAFEVVILGIKCFLPESAAATFINDKLGVAVSWVDSIKSKSNELGEPKNLEEDSKTNKNEDVKQVNASPQTAPVSKPDPIPNPNKEELVKEAQGYNTNIKAITADDSLAYDENKKYRDTDINNSKPIENNIWYEDKNGNTVYYDKEIVKAIIQFDSAWIDYINTKDTTVLGLAKEGSSAFEYAKAYSKVGKVTESFDTLKIGEIRQGGKGFYIWVYEEITMTENGKATPNNYNWIYYLEPVEQQMKIVSYTKA